MSIIYDALEKTQKNREHKSGMSIQMKYERNLSLQKVRLVIIPSLLLLIVFFSVTQFKRHFNQVAPQLAVSKPVTVSHGKQETFPSLTLNGVFLSKKNTVAVINSRTFHVGDKVNAMEIIAIGKDGVKLRNETELLHLQVAA